MATPGCLWLTPLCFLVPPQGHAGLHPGSMRTTRSFFLDFVFGCLVALPMLGLPCFSMTL